jgi:hypothetical protein
MRVGFLAFALVGCAETEMAHHADEGDGVGVAASIGPADREDEDDGTAVSGHASIPASHRDEFRQDGAWGATDIVLWTDGSGSMSDDRERLDAAAGAFTAALDESAGDWQILAVDDSGCGEILTPDDPDGAFSAAEQGSPGFEGGLAAIVAAREESGTGGCNAGFLRPDAKTLVVIVSDEPEQSGVAWEDLVDAIDDYATALTISAIAGDLPHGCATAAPARGYSEAVEATGGVFVSICSEDLEPGVASVASTAANVDLVGTFALSAPANPATLTVLVDDVPSTAWTYDATSNALTFDAPPPAGSEIVALYQETPGGP